MTSDELALHDANDRVRVLTNAIRDTERGIADRQAGCACTVEPLVRQLAVLQAKHADAVFRADLIRQRLNLPAGVN